MPGLPVRTGLITEMIAQRLGIKGSRANRGRHGCGVQAQRRLRRVRQPSHPGMAEPGGTRAAPAPRDNQPDTSSRSGSGFERVGREEADRRSRVVERIAAVETTIRNFRWFIRVMVAFTRVLAAALPAFVALINRWFRKKAYRMSIWAPCSAVRSRDDGPSGLG